MMLHKHRVRKSQCLATYKMLWEKSRPTPRCGVGAAGRHRHPGPEVLSQGGRAGEAAPGPRRGRARVAVAQRARPRRAERPAPRRPHRRRARRPPGLRPPRRLLDLLGLQARLLRRRGQHPRLLRRDAATCSPARWPRPTARSGSTPACTGPTASPARRKATSTAIPRQRRVHRSTSAYERPQPHACFIQSVDDDLVNEGGIMDLWVREARLFKYGSGTGTNFSSNCAAKASASPAAAARAG
jgi:hypothetical protein